MVEIDYSRQGQFVQLCGVQLIATLLYRQVVSGPVRGFGCTPRDNSSSNNSNDKNHNSNEKSKW